LTKLVRHVKKKMLSPHEIFSIRENGILCSAAARIRARQLCLENAIFAQRFGLIHGLVSEGHELVRRLDVFILKC
jgi:hypothetical protein